MTSYPPPSSCLLGRRYNIKAGVVTGVLQICASVVLLIFGTVAVAADTRNGAGVPNIILGVVREKEKNTYFEPRNAITKILLKVIMAKENLNNN